MTSKASPSIRAPIGSFFAAFHCSAGGSMSRSAALISKVLTFCGASKSLELCFLRIGG
jgi:hypothetical protein